MKLRATTIILAWLSTSGVGAAEPKYAGFDVTDHDNPKVSFTFSSGDAMSTYPIVITIPGRKLMNADRVHRVDLQKHWLSIHVPKGARFVGRTLSECGLKREGEFPACDRYVFEDSATKKEMVFYIYAGNWP